MENEEEIDTIFDEVEGEKHALAKINFDVADLGRWLLKVIAGPNNGAEFSLQPSTTYVIGSDPNSCDIVFYDTSVSRQHARIVIDKREEMTIEDLKSRNGIAIDGELIKGKRKLTPNGVVTLGTTAFTVYDREGEMQTIISPLLPAIVKVLQKDEGKKTESGSTAAAKALPTTAAEQSRLTEEPPTLRGEKLEVSAGKAGNALSAFIVISIITGLFLIVGLGTATLFQTKPVEAEAQVDVAKLIGEALTPFPAVKPYYNKVTGRLQLIGHVLTLAEKNRLLLRLGGLPLKEIDDSGLIIDEFSWQNINLALATKPAWRGISVHANAPGKFVITGALQTRREAERLSDYLAANFAHFDRLENRILVEEDVAASAADLLRKEGLDKVTVQISNSEVSLSGSIGKDKIPFLEKAIASIKEISGVRGVKNLVRELAPEQSIIDLSDRYFVSGFSRRGDEFSVVIQGRVLSVGDELDGMEIKSIRGNSIYLEKDMVKYKVDFSK